MREFILTHVLAGMFASSIYQVFIFFPVLVIMWVVWVLNALTFMVISAALHGIWLLLTAALRALVTRRKYQ